MKNREQIIINDIDVSECNFRLERNGKQKCECCHATGFGVICDCEKWQNCYFKQLKRLEEENKELKEQYVNFRVALGDIKNIIKFRFKTAYMTFGLKETRKIIEDIEKIVSEVLNEN